MIKKLILKGAGVRIVRYAGALQVLEQYGKLKDLESVYGTSAGAIVGTLISLKYTAKEIRDILFSLDFSKFEDKENPLRIVSEYGLYAGDYFLETLKGFITKKGLHENATFKDFKEAGMLDLHVFATCLSTESVQDFSFNETPNIPVSIAVRASMSIPILFKAVEIMNKIYVDGGLMLNYPMFRTTDTLGLFDDGGTGCEDNGLHYGHIGKYIKSLINCSLAAQDEAFFANQAFVDASIVINSITGRTYSATDFNIDNSAKLDLEVDGRIAANNWIVKHP